MKTTIKLCVSLLFVLAASSVATENKNWLKPYSQRQYGAIWHFELEIQNLKKKNDRILAVLNKYGGEPAIPTTNMASTKAGDYRQISYSFQRNNAEKALSELSKIGNLTTTTRRENYDTVADRDAKDKLVRLKTEMAAESAALKRMPAVSELASEMAETLQASVSAYAKSENVVLVNLILQENPK